MKTRANIVAQYASDDHRDGNAVMRCPVCGNDKKEYDICSYQNAMGGKGEPKVEVELCCDCVEDFESDEGCKVESDVLDTETFDKLYEYVSRNKTQPEAEANARLIASAPQLLEALKAINKLAEDGVIQRNETGKPQWNLTDELGRITRAAIAAAE